MVENEHYGQPATPVSAVVTYLNPSDGAVRNADQLERVDKSTPIGELTHRLLTDNMRVADDILKALVSTSGALLLQREAINSRTTLPELYQSITDCLAYYTPRGNVISPSGKICDAMISLGLVDDEGYIEDWTQVAKDKYLYVGDTRLMLVQEKRRLDRINLLTRLQKMSVDKLVILEKNVEIILARYGRVMEKKEEITQIENDLSPAQKTVSWFSGFFHASADASAGEENIYETLETAEGNVSLVQDLKRAINIILEGKEQ